MMDKNRNRILYYCQSLVGIGHLTASLQIIQGVPHYFDVDLIYGGISTLAFQNKMASAFFRPASLNI
jgi:predicted glycosyltransferase